MSSLCYYQAIPESSRLLERLRTEREFAVLYRQFVGMGSGVFGFNAFDPDEVDETLDWVADEILEMPRAALNRFMREFCEELARADREHDALGKRSARLEENVAWEIEDVLLQKMRGVWQAEDAAVIKATLRGGELLAPEFSGCFDVQPKIVDSDAVVGANGLLERVAFSGPEIERWVYFWEQYGRWRSLIGEAGKRGEALVVLAVD